jgi:phytoene synthase
MRATDFRYFALLYSPPAARRVLEALLGIEAQIAAGLRAGLDHHVAHSRLQWWGEECERCAQGHPVHPLTRELAAAFDPAPAAALPQLAGIRGFVDTAIWDLAGATFETRRELAAYCERWAAAMIEPLVAYALPSDVTRALNDTRAERGRVSPAPNDTASVLHDSAPVRNDSALPRPTNRWRALGAALREVELLTHLAPEAHSGRLRIPLDELDRAGADPSSLAKPPWPIPVVTLLRARHKTLQEEISSGLGSSTPDEQAALRGLMVWGALAWQASRRVQRDLPDISQPRRLDAVTDVWSAWRAARRATTGRFKLE